ncbi:MAG: hypothetical protein U0525_00155 [Patescibacteria group bacterium]
MGNILLLIPNFNLRQLYHELLLTENIEIFPVSKVENTILVESINTYDILVIHTDDIEPGAVKSLLRLQKRIEKFSSVKIALLTADEYAYHKCLTGGDKVINVSKKTPVDTVQEIHSMLNKSV